MTGSMSAVGGDFSLVDHNDRPVRLASFSGGLALIFFGFTHCRKVCPETLSKISGALEELGERASEIQPLYITVDPARDTPEVLKAFLSKQYPRFTGLTGTGEKIEEARARFRVFARRVADQEDPDGYAVPHSALIYLLDEEGQFLRHFPDGVSHRDLVDGLRSALGDER
ncbi:MAG: SCO family protein [Parvibaculum sp.]